VVLWSGFEKGTLNERHEGLTSAVDFWHPKPGALDKLLRSQKIRTMIAVDDSLTMRHTLKVFGKLVDFCQVFERLPPQFRWAFFGVG
jgi:hypothetical protein